MHNLVKELCALDGVSGTEDAVRDYIKSRVAPYASDIQTDVMGNLIVYKKGKRTPSKTVMLCSHMDEVGVIITDYTDEGYLKFTTVGSIDRRVIIGKTIYLGKGRTCGVIGNKAIHLVKREERDKIPLTEDMYIDIGVKSKSEAEQLVQLGETGVFGPSVIEFGNGFVKAKALDDRVGCAVLLKLLESELPIDCTFTFSAQEEVGTRGVFGAAFRVAPDIVLVVEGTTAADLPGVSSAKRVCALGKGVVIPFMDGGTIYNRELYTLLTGLAEKNGIPWQTKSYISGGTDASAVQRSKSGVMTAGIAAPIRNLHSPACVGNASDFDAVYKLAAKFLDAMGELY